MATRKRKHDFIQHHHLLMRMELMDCPERKDIPRVKGMVTNILKALNMKSLAPPRVYYLDKPENNRGMTCIAPIKTSHIAFHFWSNPDHSIFQNKESRCLLEFDIYTCGSMGPNTVKQILHQLAPYRPTHADIDILNRRKGMELEHHFSWDKGKRPDWDDWLESKAFLHIRRNRNRKNGKTRKQRGGRPVHMFLLMINNVRDKIRHLVNIITAAHADNPDHYENLYTRARDVDSLTQQLAVDAREAAEQGNEELGFDISEKISNDLKSLQIMWDTTLTAEEHALVPSQNGGGIMFDVVFYTEVGHTIHKHIIPPFETPLLTRFQTARRSPDVLFEKEKNRAYVIVIYDEDAPHPARVHWLYTQWFDRRGRLDDEILIPYEPPNPPQGETHTYTVQLLSKITGPGMDIVNTVPNKNGFNIEQFMEAEGLISEAVRTFKVGPE
uniref:Phosphatidylethanolamine-binding protein n=1 Tax=viral metagenome TaxID=1070528 RepID=A0A6C0LP56_9ZZZZ